MSKPILFRRPLNHSYKSHWYWNHDKRLTDALVAQFGRDDEERHADGLHRKRIDPFGRRIETGPNHKMGYPDAGGKGQFK